MSAKISWFAAAAILLAAAGCATSSSEKLPPPKSSTTVVLGPDNRTVVKSIGLQTALKIVLPPPSEGPGYVWEVLSGNTKVLVQTSEVTPVTGPGGTVTAYELVFQSIRVSPPRSIVTLAAVKQGAVESEPTDLYLITVTVKDE